MAEQYDNTTVPYSPSDADFQRRLINFETGRHELLPDHAGWLNDLLKATPATREFHCHVYGYASKLGDTTKNETLSFNRASSVARYLEERDPKYTTRIETFRAFGENDPNYVAGASDNDGRWRAVEVHVKFDRPPVIKPGTIKIPPKNTRTKMRWSVSGYFELNASIMHVAQFGIGLFKFRDDETKITRTYLAPMVGLGGGIDILKIIGALRGLVDKKLPKWAHLEATLTRIMKNPALLANPYAVLKEIGTALLTGAGLQDWTDFTRCDVYHPLTHNTLNGQSIGNISGTGGLYQAQKIIVYGKVWYTEASGKRMFGTRDLLSASSKDWVAQVPALSAGAVGGPLILL